MKRAEAEKLLGGYATGTLTEAEWRALFEAALADQGLFNALADEEALRELLADARVRRRLLAALAEEEAGLWERVLAWWRRPWAWGVAGSVAVAALLVVMLVPVYQTTKGPQVQPAAQVPAEMAKKAEPFVAPAPAPSAPRVAAARRPQRAAPPAQLAAPAPEPAAPVPERRAIERAEEKQVLAEAEAKPKLEAAPAAVVGAVAAPEEAKAVAAGGVTAPAPRMAALEADARALYYGPGAEWKGISTTALRAQRAADVAATPAGPAGLRYAIQKLGPEGQYAEVAPGAVFAKGDVIRLSVEANQGGVIRLTRQGAAGTWSAPQEVRVGPRERRLIPERGLRLEDSEKLVLEFVRAGAAPVPAGKPLLQKAADEGAVYVVDAGGAAQVRAEIELIVR